MLLIAGIRPGLWRISLVVLIIAACPASRPDSSAVRAASHQAYITTTPLDAIAGRRTIRLPGMPIVWADDPSVDRMIVLTIATSETGSGGPTIGRNTICFLNAMDGRIVASRPFSFDSSTGDFLAVDSRTQHVLAYGNHVIETFDAVTGRLLRSARVHTELFGLALDTALSRAYFGNFDRPEITIVSTQSGAVIRTVHLATAAHSFVFQVKPIGVTYEHNVVLLAQSDPLIVDPRSGKIIHDIHLPVGEVGAYDALRDRFVVLWGLHGKPAMFTISAKSGSVVRTTLLTPSEDDGLGLTVIAHDGRAARAAFLEIPADEGATGRRLHVVDLSTGRQTASVRVKTPPGSGDAFPQSEDTGVIDAATGHVLLLLENDPFALPEEGCYLESFDATGRLLHTVHLVGTALYERPTMAIDNRFHRVYVANTDTGLVTIFNSAQL